MYTLHICELTRFHFIWRELNEGYDYLDEFDKDSRV